MKWPIELKQVTSSFSPWYVCCLLDYRWLLWLCLLKLDVHKTFGLCIFNLWGRAKPKYHMSSSTFALLSTLMRFIDKVYHFSPQTVGNCESFWFRKETIIFLSALETLVSFMWKKTEVRNSGFHKDVAARLSMQSVLHSYFLSVMKNIICIFLQTSNKIVNSP